MSIDLSLNRLKQLFPHLPYARPTLHIAGTNGKGSVSALLTSILMTSSPPLRIGRFNGPHLVSILDSITIDNIDVSRNVYDRVRQEVESIDRAQGTKLTGFEMLAMTALCIFETEKVDIVILEVGMGGRLDATNIVPSSCILVSALTAVDLDHQAFLGDTVSLIAREKAGIAREGKPFVLGRQTHSEVEEVVKEVVGSVGGTLMPASRVSAPERTISNWSLLDNISALGPPPKLVEFHSQFFNSLIQARFPLHGDHQLDNLGTTLGVVEALLSDSEACVPSLKLKTRITQKTLVNGIENVKWRGRLSFHNISIPLQPSPTSTSTPRTSSSNLLVLADGAHNPASAKTLGTYISSLLDPAMVSPFPPSHRDHLCIPITYILSLSHSPPKMPFETLSPILSPSLFLPISDSSSSSHAGPKVSLHTSVALLPFSPPEGMSWVKPVPLQAMREAMRTIMPDLADDALWVGSEVERTKGVEDGKGNSSLREALMWAVGRHTDASKGHMDERMRGLVVLAGSLYLVADFYRLLETEP